MADDTPVHVALVATGVDGERWRGWLSDAGARVTVCAGWGAVLSLTPRPSVAIVDAASDVDAPDETSDRLADVPVVVLTHDHQHRTPLPGRSVTLPRAASRAALVGAALALASGLRVEGGLPGTAGRTGSARPGAIPGPPLDEDEEWPSESPTAREREVIEFAALGLTNRAIAARLGLSDHTVKFHLASIYGKLGARGRTEAVRRAIRRGWIAI